MPTLELRVTSDYDDAWEAEWTGDVDALDYYIWTRSNTTTTRMWTGFRWTSGSFPLIGTATVTVCWIKIYKYGDADLNCDVHFQLAAAPATFQHCPTTGCANITGRSRSVAFVPWVAALGGDGWKTSPSLVTPMQEIFDNYSPTAVAAILKPKTDLDKTCKWASYKNGAGFAAYLHVEWDVGYNPAQASAPMGAKMIAGKMI